MEGEMNVVAGGCELEDTDRWCVVMFIGEGGRCRGLHFGGYL